MSDLDELIETANKLCAKLDMAAENEKKYCHEMCYQLDILSYETLKIINDIKTMKETLC